jgi:signal transduction histidine kinase
MDFARPTDAQAAPLCAEGQDALLAATPDVLLCLSPDGRLRHAGDSVEALCAQPPVVGAALEDSGLPEEIVAAIDGSVRAALATGVAATTGFSFECRQGALPGARRLEATVTPLTDADGRVEQLIVLRDHTRTQRVIERYEHALADERRRRESVERTLMLRERFLALLSHELRSPLHAIQNWTNLLEKTLGTASTPLVGRAIEGLLRGVADQVSVLDRLLESPHDAAAQDLPLLMPLNDDRRRPLRDDETDAA